MQIPSWVCLPAAVVVYFLVLLGVRFLSTSNPLIVGFAGIAPMAGGMMAFLVLLAGFKAAMEKWSRRRLLAKQTSIESVRDLSWSAFELLIGEAYRQQGYEVFETGQGGADGGIDLKLRRNGVTSLVQCKQWKAWTVGVKPVRELYGVMTAEGAGRAVFVTSGRYTAEAREFARGKPMELIDGEVLMHLIKQVETAPAQEIQLPTVASTSAQSCPNCAGGMILRTAKKGARAGAQFWAALRTHGAGGHGRRPEDLPNSPAGGILHLRRAFVSYVS